MAVLYLVFATNIILTSLSIFSETFYKSLSNKMFDKMIHKLVYQMIIDEVSITNLEKH
ncbi:hypothetical protein [Proteiniborus sp. DW1]|uniref:hypothetical protein n=1 Tax=Proteiniborus sp. DW1 TaxID=1889883 RepID=UPI0013563B24|nr:hypothetical protein [Proteiniborus sp. DW1]